MQISSAWNIREGAPLGRNRYVELQIKKRKTNGSAAKQPAIQKPCEKMTEAIVMDGGNRGQLVKVCADPNCRVHRADRPSPQQLQRDRVQERKRIEREDCNHRTAPNTCNDIGARFGSVEENRPAHGCTACRQQCVVQSAPTHREAPQAGNRKIQHVSRGAFVETRLAL